MPKPSLPRKFDGRRLVKTSMAKGTFLAKPAPSRTKGGRVTYAGADFAEQKTLRAIWDGPK